MRTTVAILAAALVTLPLAARAEDGAAPGRMVDPDGRGWTCVPQGDGLACRPEVADIGVPDASLAAEVDALKDRVATLEREIAALKRGGTGFSAADERDLDRFLTFSDKAVRRFFGMVKDLKQDLGEENRL